MPVQIRPATEGDLDALLALYVQLSPENAGADRDLAAAGLQTMFADTHVSLLVASLDGMVVGTVTLIVVPNLTHNARPWIQLENMVVDESVRRSGAGRALLEAAEALAQESSAYKIQLQSADHRHGAHAFYKSAGFKASSLGFRKYYE